MPLRRPICFVLFGAALSTGASFRTQNFVVEAPTAEVARQVGQYAEHYRREKALEWINQEMPPWPEPCPLRVKVTMGGAGGATSFAFHPNGGAVLGQTMNVEGSLERILASVLPHEITHTVFAYYFRQPVPRWADEGGAVLSEDDQERSRHDLLARQILNTGKAFTLRRLFALKEYPNEVMTLYAEGYSVVSFLVSVSSRQEFLQFVARGMNEGWDRAAQVHYQFKNLDELEQAWLNHLRTNRRTAPPPAVLARNTTPAQPAPVEAAKRSFVRLTAPPVQPTLDATPLVRAQAGEDNDRDDRPRRDSDRRPGYLPNPPASPRIPATPPPSSGVRLMAPQFGSATAPPSNKPTPGPASPVGYPY